MLNIKCFLYTQPFFCYIIITKMASKAKQINKTFTSLQLIGGVDCVPDNARFPDLYVAGGARIKKRLCVKDVDVTSTLNVKGTANVNQLNATTANIGGLSVRNSLTVCDTIQGKGKLVVDSDMVVNGTVFSSEDEFTQIFTFQGNGNVIIEPIVDPGLMFNNSTLKIVNPPCSGNILSVNPMTGNITYCPQSEPAKTDLYQYCINDSCGLPHIVTQFICQQQIGTLTFPFLNNECVQYSNDGTASSFPANVDVTSLVVKGTHPIDYGTVTVKDFTVYLSGYQTGEHDCGNVMGASWGTFSGDVPLISIVETGPNSQWAGSASGPYAGTSITINLSYNGTDTLSLDYFDSPAGTFVNIDLYARVTIQVSDDMGNPTNCATVFFVPQ